MRGGALPPALLCAALGLTQALAPRSAQASNLILAMVTASVVAVAPLPSRWLEVAFMGCWMSVTVSAASVHVQRALTVRTSRALAVNAGLWCGAVIALAGSPRDLVVALPCTLIAIPAAWLVHRRMPIAIKVISSWLIAVALLAALLQCAPVTPGYAPDHMD